MAGPAEPSDLSGLVAAAERGALPGNEKSAEQRGRRRPLIKTERLDLLVPLFDDRQQAAAAVRAAITDAVATTLAETVSSEATSSRRSRSTSISPGSRMLVADGAVLVLDPALDFAGTKLLEDSFDMMSMVWERLQRAARAPDMTERERALLGGVDGAMIEAAAPHVIHTRLPRMEPLCVPTPPIEVGCPPQISTAGLFCRDAQGTLGITACLHGTGPVGTRVTVGLREFEVRLAHPVQDLVFIPLPSDYNFPLLLGRGGPCRDRAPGQGDPVRFVGVKSGATTTWISSHDTGLLRQRATVQLKVQTGPDANPGDSGAVLIDADDRVVGFAFERSAYGDKPEFTDWIWAANALAALGLSPVTT